MVPRNSTAGSSFFVKRTIITFLAQVETLETLWADDNAITDFPRSVLHLR